MSERKYYNEEPIRQTFFSKNLILRPYCEETDKTKLLRMITSDKDFINYSLYKMDRKRLTRDLSDKCFLLYSTGEWSFIIEGKKDKAVMGFVNLDSSYGINHHVLKLGYYMGSKYREHGYMQEALSTIIDAGFKGKLYQLDDMCFKNRKYVIHAFKAATNLDNDVSDHILRKLGFVCTGIELCRYCDDKKYAIDQRHYYLENPKHPPLRKYENFDKWQDRMFKKKFAPYTNKPLNSEFFHKLLKEMDEFYDGSKEQRIVVGGTEILMPKIDEETGLPIMPEDIDKDWNY